jgi:hypothetical protein
MGLRAYLFSFPMVFEYDYGSLQSPFQSLTNGSLQSSISSAISPISLPSSPISLWELSIFFPSSPISLWELSIFLQSSSIPYNVFNIPSISLQSPSISSRTSKNTLKTLLEKMSEMN